MKNIIFIEHGYYDDFFLHNPVIVRLKVYFSNTIIGEQLIKYNIGISANAVINLFNIKKKNKKRQTVKRKSKSLECILSPTVVSGYTMYPR